ncbi:ABC transporter, ATP-binding protein EcsA [Bacillus sp. JCM 19046]|uniref:ABC-2 type transport system ATP-binding protein n=1 Tax=Shouchella xiaoxiensis TaxID=766895 RepID=A0ABS2SU23_9BACI|nr:ABC transporter ATP-binding protein [Shouchella xiaoxiensis]MBM7837969.1 ABC-2 type transport system ATP-binding protein [Shouchella xiaoxiensis]GAF12270.1 ABC transporter, ATP-binding protein EcsA [Bacillus sp. JCM 19045]GAF18653.1 ABC transporter, ATP-binding protein EcsA [Bacillus sp. JCM 19046]
MSDLLKIEQLTGGYTPKKPVLHNVSFTVKQEEIVGLIGLNGAGKSTTIKHVLGLMDPQKGQVKINDLQFSDDADTYRRSFAYIPETPMLYDELTLWEHLELTSVAYGIEHDVFVQRAEKLLKEFHMSKMKKWYPNHFSKGMRQKVMIMSAFLAEPSLYVVDEPIVGLDPVGIQSFLNWISAMKEQGAAVLMSTHILATAERYCDRFVILHQGEVVLTGTLAEMRVAIEQPNATLDDIYIEMTKEDRQ